MSLSDERRFAYTLAPLTFTTMLLISQVLGYPNADDVFSAFGDASYSGPTSEDPP